MPYKDIEKKREYQRNWYFKKRIEWIERNGPCKCGSWCDLEIDHIDPKTKISSKIWSWSEDRRNVELAKCQVLCYDCHLYKTIESRRSNPDHGTIAKYKHKSFPCKCDKCKEANAEYESNRRYEERSGINTASKTM
jgi:hypothetical protein